MSKELEALEELFDVIVDEYDGCEIMVEFQKYKDIIETALKNYEELTSKPVILYGRTHGQTKALIDMISKNYKEIRITNLDDEKKLKALEIIKNKNVNCCLINQCKNAREYNQCLIKHGVVGARHFNITKQEFDLLKEVLE